VSTPCTAIQAMDTECWNFISQIKAAQEELQQTKLELNSALKRFVSLVDDAKAVRQDVNNAQGLLQNMQEEVKKLKHNVDDMTVSVHSKLDARLGDSKEIWTNLHQIQSCITVTQKNLEVARHEVADLQGQVRSVHEHNAAHHQQGTKRAKWSLRRMSAPANLSGKTVAVKKTSSAPPSNSQDLLSSSTASTAFAECRQETSDMAKYGQKLAEYTGDQNSPEIEDLRRWWAFHCSTDAPALCSQPPSDTSPNGPSPPGKQPTCYPVSEQSSQAERVDSRGSGISIRTFFTSWKTKPRPQSTKSKGALGKQSDSERTTAAQTD